MIKVTTFYHFFLIHERDLKNKKEQLLKQGKKHNIRGLFLLGTEGVNATLAGRKQDLECYKKELDSLFCHSFKYKDSSSNKWNFKRLSVKIKKEIIRAEGRPMPDLKKEGHLNPKGWEKHLKTCPQILDIRNNYEVEIGQFKGASHLNLEKFQDFSKKLKKSSLKKDKKTLIYCTGGIRCEKAKKIMKEQGFKEVYQLEGGILNYLKHYPHSQFEKECFVFDHRVSVNQELNPSKQYQLCPHCGQPANKPMQCLHCEKPFLLCSSCLKKDSENKTCSKNCSYHFKMNHTCRKKYKPPGEHSSIS